ncbi:MAG: EAL domain-containing protein [Blastocatellia bacterium]|nr:EAL domain-containing protein [Blastocatellia bacterium]
MIHKTLLDRMLEPGGLSVLFQPIFELKEEGWRLHALECLIRGPRGTNIEQASILFDYARKKREESLVDRACLTTVLKEAAKLPGEAHLCINVHASTLGRDHGFAAFVKEMAAEHAISHSRLTIEIVEQVPFWDGPSFSNTLEEFRSTGIQIALDDVGLGQSNYRMALYCRPDYFKVDRHFVQGSHKDVYRQAILESISLLARRFSARVVVEGIEMVEDLDATTSMGIDLVQGYLLSPPITGPELIEKGFLEGRIIFPREASHPVTVF